MNEEMKKAMAGKAMPELAIVDNNTLAALGLKGLLESVVPMVKISIFGTFGEFESNAPERFMHYFVSMQILLAHRNFFIEEAHRPPYHRAYPLQRPQLTDAGIPLHLHQHTGIKAHPTVDPPAAFGTSPRRIYPADGFLRVQGESPFRQGNRGTLAGGTRQNQQGDSRKALHQYHHRDYPPQEYPGKTGYQERFFAHHLCRDARLCGYQQDLTLRGIPQNDDATLSHTYI